MTDAAVAPPRPAGAPRRLVRGLRGDLGGAIGFLLLAALLVVAVLGGRIAPEDPFAPVAPALLPPSATYPFGTDDLGRDLLAGVVHGLRTSLLVGAVVAAISGTIGTVVGALAGAGSRLVDDLLMRLTEFVQVIPRFFLAVVVIALWGPRLDRLVLLLGVTSWTWTARVVRAETLSLRGREFVDAARALGASASTILLRHIVPNALPPTVVMVSLGASTAILIEAGLGFVGLADPDVVSLGSLAADAQPFLRRAWWMAVFPGVGIVAAVLAINLVGDALNDRLDPRRR